MLASASAKFNEVIFLFTSFDEGELWVRAVPSVWKMYFTLIIGTFEINSLESFVFQIQ